jgi:hypothetical protein
MSEGERVTIVGLFFMILVYVMFSTLDLPRLLGSERRLPPTLQLVHQSLVTAFWRREPSPARLVAEFIAVVLFTQVVPFVLLVDPEMAVEVRVASLIELVLAVFWTVLLVLAATPPTED